MAEIKTKEPTEKVEVNKQDLQAMLKQNKDLQKRVEGLEAGAPKILKRVTERVARFRVLDGQLVIGYTDKGSYEEMNDNTNKMVTYLDVIKYGIDKPVKMNLLQFLTLKDEYLKIIKTDRQIVEEDGGGHVASAGYNEYSRAESSMIVPLVVTYEKCIHTVELPDGSTMEVEDKFMNM